MSEAIDQRDEMIAKLATERNAHRERADKAEASNRALTAELHAAREDETGRLNGSGPPWLADAAEALGQGKHSLNWSQVLNAIRALRSEWEASAKSLAACEAELLEAQRRAVTPEQAHDLERLGMLRGSQCAFALRLHLGDRRAEVQRGSLRNNIDILIALLRDT